MAAQRLNIYAVRPLEGFSLNEAISNLISANTPNSYCIINEQNDTYIGGCYLLEKFKHETSYNMDSMQFETTIVKRLIVVKFDLNIQAGLLMIWGSKTASVSLVTTIGQAANNRIIIDTKTIEFKKAMNIVLDGKHILLSRMKINNIVIDDGIVVSCSVNLTDLDDARGTASKYLDNISQITMILGKESKYDDGFNVTVTLYNSGSLVIYSDRDEITNEILEDIYKIIRGVQ